MEVVPGRSFSKVTRVHNKSARAFACMYIGREGGGRDMTPVPTSYINCGPCPLTVVQEAVLASGQVRFDRDVCWREARLGLLAASSGNGTCPPGTVYPGARSTSLSVGSHQTRSRRLLPLFPFACLHG